ncbi:hypothetical protein FIBSPDRAFT_860092 [Athelia psychrophila]|uniref:Uncharacterized protein n=1 Tax=Athelia psychrophila TaxID=1759441 RepID=A0A166KI90_9AGAM|nr:hypothetical protein FIBSPDRAFT_860092 [Fibularhizoctonia sp. CBS 109695]
MSSNWAAGGSESMYDGKAIAAALILPTVHCFLISSASYRHGILKIAARSQRPGQHRPR